MQKLLPLSGIAVAFCVFALSGGNAFSQENAEEEMFRQFFADVDITQAELMQLGVNLAGVFEPYQQATEEFEKRFNPATRENYIEYIDSYFDLILSPMFRDMRAEAANFFTEDQYDKLTLRLYQVTELFPESMKANEIPVGDIAQLFIYPDVVPMTEAQLSELVALQKEVLTEFAGIGLIVREDNAELFAEQDALFQEMEKAESEEEKTVIREKIRAIMQKASDLMREPMQKSFDKMKSKLDTLLTAEQKAKLAQIKQDTPEYLKKALAGLLKTGGDEAEPSAAWRPGANSWVPGMGAPMDLKSDIREAPRERTRTGGGRAFSGE